MAINPLLGSFLAHVASQARQPGPPAFEWDEWAVHTYVEPLDEAEIDRLGALTPHALLCLATGLTLWTYHRLSPFGLNPAAADFIEVVSASTIEAPAFDYRPLDPDDWRGPQNGPFAVSLDALIDSVHDPAQVALLGDNVFCTLQMARRACEGDPALEDWYAQVRDRLLATRRLDQERPADHLPGFFDLHDFLSAPVPLSELMLDGEGRPLARFTFADQVAALDPSNPLRRG